MKNNTGDLYSPLAKLFKPGKRVKQNNKGYVPYSLCTIIIDRLSYSCAVCTLHYTHGGQAKTQPNIYIPYEHLEISNA